MIYITESSISDIDYLIHEIDYYENLLKDARNFTKEEREDIESHLKTLRHSLRGFMDKPEQVSKEEKDTSEELREPLDPFRFVVYRSDIRGNETYLAGSNKYTKDIKSARLFTGRDADSISRRMTRNSKNNFDWKFKEIKRR